MPQSEKSRSKVTPCRQNKRFVAIPMWIVTAVSKVSENHAIVFQVLPNIWAVHHDPENFDNPSEFKPERFIDEQGKFNKDSKVIPFSIGPRYCLGEQLARMEIFLFLISIVQRFEVRSDPSSPLPTIHESNLGLADVPKLFDVSFIPREWIDALCFLLPFSTGEDSECEMVDCTAVTNRNIPRPVVHG